MAQKQKLDLEEKVKLIKSYQSGKQGLRRSADLAGVAYETFRRWVGLYEAEGADAFKVPRQRVREWCGEHGIPVSTYYSWQRKVYQAAVSENEVCFAEVSVRSAAAETAASIQCGELRVDIHAGADPETIRAIIQLYCIFSLYSAWRKTLGWLTLTFIME